MINFLSIHGKLIQYCEQISDEREKTCRLVGEKDGISHKVSSTQLWKYTRIVPKGVNKNITPQVFTNSQWKYLMVQWSVVLEKSYLLTIIKAGTFAFGLNPLMPEDRLSSI